mgnify:FL=1
MAYNTELINYVSQTAGGSANVTTQPADNCHTIVVFNSDATNSARVAVAANGTTLTAANSALIPAGGSLTLRIGTSEYRPFGTFQTSQRVLICAAVAGSPILNFQYLNSTRAVAP